MGLETVVKYVCRECGQTWPTWMWGAPPVHEEREHDGRLTVLVREQEGGE